MKRKDYSNEKPVPRQTLWSQKKKKEKDEKARQKQEKAKSSRQKQHENRTEDEDSETTRKGEAEYFAGGENDDVNANKDAQNLFPTANENATALPLEYSVPVLPLRRESDSDHYLSSDEDDAFSIPGGDITQGIESDSDRSDCDDSVGDPTVTKTGDDSPGDSETGELIEGAAPAACLPEKKYRLLVHLLRTKHQLTKEATDEVMEIINDLSSTCLGKEFLPKDSRTLGKMYDSYLPDVEKHYTCPKCGVYVGKEKRGQDSYRCLSCKSTSLFKNSEHFYYMPLASQLRQIFEDNYHEVSVALISEVRSSDSSHLICSVKDGSKYKQYLKTTDKTVQQISLTFSCDSVPVFDSSNSSLVPVTCTINELPMTLRKRYILVPAVWYGVNKKPDKNQFLYPFVRETNILHDRGFIYYKNGEEQICKVTVLKNISDSVERAQLSNSHQFNGAYGCVECYHPGQQVQKDRGTVRVYPHLENVQRRTSQETKQLAEEAASLERKPYHVKGIKGKTILMHIPGFDIVDGLLPDYMHASILGTVRQFAKLWINSKYKSEEWYIGDKKKEINRRLAVLKPPFYFSRPPRAVEEMAFWKGHEWYFWGLIYSVIVLKNVLPKRFLKHWMLFVEGLYLLLQESITKSQVHNATALFIQFTKGTEELYGVAHCSFNVHLGEHLGTSVLNWGNLWENSAFLYEDYYQVILKTIHSSKGVLDQVVKQIRTARSVPALLATPVGSAVKDMKVAQRERLFSTDNSVVCSTKTCECIVLSPKIEQITNPTRLALASVGIHIKKKQTHLFSSRIVENGEVFHSQSYTRVKRRNSYTVLLTTDNVFVVEKYVVVDNSCFAVGRFLEPCRSFTLFSDRDALPFQRFVKKKAGPLCVVNVCEFVSKVVFLKCYHFDTVDVVCIPPNRNEILK